MTSLPVNINMPQASNGTHYVFNTHDAKGFPLTVWDSEHGGLCDDDVSIAVPVITTPTCLFSVSGLPFTAFELGLYNWEPKETVTGAPTLFITMYGGQKNGSIKLLECSYTPLEFGSSLLFQLSGILMTEVYIFGEIIGPHAIKTKAAFRFQAARLNTSGWTSFKGPDVVLAGPF